MVVVVECTPSHKICMYAKVSPILFFKWACTCFLRRRPRFLDTTGTTTVIIFNFLSPQLHDHDKNLNHFHSVEFVDWVLFCILKLCAIVEEKTMGVLTLRFANWAWKLNLRSFARFCKNFAGKRWDFFSQIYLAMFLLFAKLFHKLPLIISSKRKYRNPWKQRRKRWS